MHSAFSSVSVVLVCLSMLLATAQITPCVVSLTVQQHDATVQVARFPCLVGNFGVQKGIEQAELIEGVSRPQFTYCVCCCRAQVY